MTKFTDKYGPVSIMRALSWKQPFASLMLHGKVETRTWDTSYRGWVLICASKTPYTFNQIMNISGNILAVRAIFDKPLAQAIAVGYLHNAETMFRYDHFRPLIEDKTFVKYNPHLWLHEYTDVQPIQPFAWKGTQGWKKLDQETIDKIVLI